MDEIATKKHELQRAMPVGIKLDDALAVLRSKGIRFRELKYTSEANVLERENQSIVVAPGDRVVSARFPTGASQFPCSYDMQVVLLFGNDDRLKQQHVGRLRVCP